MASLKNGPLPDGVVANGESNGEPELLEWLSDDCRSFQSITRFSGWQKETMKKKIEWKKAN